MEAERFITLLLREPFDYTSWQRQLWVEKSVDELGKARWNANALRRTRAGADAVNRAADAQR